MRPRLPKCCVPGRHEAGGELDVARAAAAEEGVADAHVGRDGERQEADASARRGVDAVEAGVGGEAR